MPPADGDVRSVVRIALCRRGMTVIRRPASTFGQESQPVDSATVVGGVSEQPVQFPACVVVSRVGDPLELEQIARFDRAAREVVTGASVMRRWARTRSRCRPRGA
jgi:hypothetical protein